VSATASTASEGTGTRRLLVAMALASGITSIPNAAMVLAIPVLHQQLDASTTEVQWTITGYLLAYSAFLITAGRLADQFGRVRLVVAGTVLYMAASVVGALAGSALLLIVAMIVIGVGAAVLTPGSLAIVTEGFRGSRRGLAVGIWGGATALFSGIGPAVGGVFTTELSWRWILWLNVIVGLVILIGMRGTPESRDEQADKGIDVGGIIASVGGLSLLTLALNETPDVWAWGSVQTIASLALGAACLVAFVFIERRVKAPLVDLAFFRRRNLTGALIVLFVLDFAFGAVLFFIPVYLEEIRHASALDAGLLVLPASVLTMAAMPFGGKLYDRFGPLPPIVTGMALSGAGMLVLSGIDASTRYGDIWWPLALLGLGLGVALTPMNLCALNAVEQRHHGTVGGIITTVGGLGGTFGVALTGAVDQSLQINHTVQSAAQAGIDVSHDTAATLITLLGGAPSGTAALHSFPAGQQATLTSIVNDSFLSALDDAMLMSFGILVVGIVLATVLIRHGKRVSADIPTPNVANPISALSTRP
jgi:EmrB/QacA subfamily drug resistance transporter